MLLKSGADANLAMADGRTPIHIAAESGNIGVIKLLLENEADILAIDEVKATDAQGALLFQCLLLLRMAKQLSIKFAKCATMMYWNASWILPSKITQDSLRSI